MSSKTRRISGLPAEPKKQSTTYRPATMSNRNSGLTVLRTVNHGAGSLGVSIPKPHQRLVARPLGTLAMRRADCERFIWRLAMRLESSQVVLAYPASKILKGQEKPGEMVTES
jgi:hypothetical protein